MKQNEIKVNELFEEVKGTMIREWEFLTGNKVTGDNMKEVVNDTVWSQVNRAYYKNNFLKNEDDNKITEILKELENKLLQVFLKEDC